MSSFERAGMESLFRRLVSAWCGGWIGIGKILSQPYIFLGKKAIHKPGGGKRYGRTARHGLESIPFQH